MGVQSGRWTGGYVEGKMDGWMDGIMHRYAYVHTGRWVRNRSCGRVDVSSDVWVDRRSVGGSAECG